MGWSLTPTRRDDPELMDALGLPEAEVAEAYRILRRVNRQLGNLATMRRELDRFFSEDAAGMGTATMLDVGSGSGDIPDALRGRGERWGRTLRVIALDRDPTAISLASRRGVTSLRGDATRLPMDDASVDLVTAIKFAHHFAGPELIRLLGEMSRVARSRVVVLDIRRNWLAYAGFVAWSRVFTRNALVRYDGPLSVLRGFTRSELLDAVSHRDAFAWDVRAYPGFQLALVGRRIVTGHG